MAELLLPGDILSMTARAADRLMGAGNGDAALLYLWLLRRGGRLEPEAARRALKWDVPRLEAALSALVGLGLADGTAAPEAPARMEPEGPPEYTAADITRELEDGASSFPGLVNEVQRRLGKILSTSDLKSLYTLYDYLALPAEVICLLVSWCVEEFQRKYGPGRKPRMSQIQKEGFVWRRLGVDTAQAAEALDDKPACPKCSDTGWVGANMCACLKALCTEEQIRELSKLLDLGEQSFDSFSLDYYSPLPWPGESLSPRENMEFIFDVCSSYARKFGRFYFRNLFLTGAPGLGKTFLSACIARTVSESGFSVVYDTAVNIFTRFEEQKFARDRLEAGEAKDETRRYLGCDLLILDDLGSELSTPFVQSALYTLINTRLTADKRTVISSNLTMDQVRARYTPQIASRLEGEYRVLPFYGEDIRLLRKQTL